MATTLIDARQSGQSSAPALPGPFGVATWLVVFVVGALVLGLVFGLSLFPRLDAGQRVINHLKPAFVPARVAGDTPAINMVSAIVNTLDPIMTPQGGASTEVPNLVGFLSTKTGLTDAQVVSTLEANFPDLAHLLLALPLSSVTAELPGLETYLATALHATPAQVLAALQANFPGLAQSIVNLPAVTSGWDNVPGTAGFTNFDGSPIQTVPQVRDYFAGEVVPLVADNQTNFGRLADWFPPVWSIPVLLLVIGIVVVLLALVMIVRSWQGAVTASLAQAGWAVVTAVGVLVLVVVFAFQLSPRLSGGQRLVNGAKPLFTPARVAGNQAGINIISSAVDAFDPVVASNSVAAGEVLPLVTYVSDKTGIPGNQLFLALQAKFPAVVNLLQAIPLSSVTAEIPQLLSFLETTLHLTEAQLGTALQTNFPALTQALVYLPTVTNDWNDVPGTAALTRFNGSPVRSVPQIRDYFKDDVIPAVTSSRADFHTLAYTDPALTVFAPLLTIIGVVVVLYGLVLLMLSRRFGRFVEKIGPT